MKLITDIDVFITIEGKLNKKLNSSGEFSVVWVVDFEERYLICYNLKKYLKYGLDRYMMFGTNLKFVNKEGENFISLGREECTKYHNELESIVKKVENRFAVNLTPKDLLIEVVGIDKSFYAEEIWWYLKKLGGSLGEFVKSLSFQYGIACIKLNDEFEKEVFDLLEALNVKYKFEEGIVYFIEKHPWTIDFLIPKPVHYLSKKQGKKAKARLNHMKDYVNESRMLGYKSVELDRLEEFITNDRT